MLYQVRPGYVVHLGPRQTLGPGEVFEPSPDVLAGQAWKLEPVVPATPKPIFSRADSLSCELQDDAWAGSRCFIIGGGPSLKEQDLSRLQGELTIGINRVFDRIDPTLIFAADSRFYKWLQSGSLGARTLARYHDCQARKVWLKTDDHEFGPEVETIPYRGTFKCGGPLATGIFSGSNSGVGALNLAVALGGNPIYLLGFDCHSRGGPQQWSHDGYPEVQGDEVYKNFRQEFERLAPILQEQGVRVVNLNPDSSIRCFEFGSLADIKDQVTVITPTGDRPEALALLRRWLAAQTLQPAQWLIVDDGKHPVDPKEFPGATVVRREPQPDDPACTLGKNLAAALPLAAHNKVLVMEDDDCYGPDYIETLAGLLDGHELAGIWGTKCYHPGVPGFRVMGREDHASLSQTGFRKSFIPQVLKAIPGDCSVDLRLWWEQSGGKGHLISGADRQLHCAIKGLPGRAGAGCAHDKKDYTRDPDLRKFREWCGGWAAYHDYFPQGTISSLKPTSRIVVYTAIAGSGRDSLQDPVPVPGVDYVCFTDQPFKSKVWEIRPFSMISKGEEAVRTAKHPKVLPHRYFPEHKISVWVDGNILPKADIAHLVQEYLLDHDLAVHRHPRRSCAYQEAGVVIRNHQDHIDLVQKTVARLRKAKMPEKNGLCECGILVRRHHAPAVKQAMELWWQEIEAGTSSDQIAFAYVLWRTGLRVKVIETPSWDNLRDNPHFIFKPHETLYWGKEATG